MTRKSIFRRVMNRVLHLLAQIAPGATTVRPFLHKLRGVKIYGNVFIGDQVYLENEFPELVELHDGAQLLLRTIIVAHNRGCGKVVIGKNAWVGTNSVVTAPVGRTLTIGEGVVVAASSVVTRDVEPYMFVGGSPAKPIAKVNVPLALGVSYNDFKNGLERL